MPAQNFNASWDAVAVQQALKIGDKKAITNILCRRSLNQRLQIAAAYKTSCKKNLIDDVKSKVSGNLKGVYVNLLMTPQELYCRTLRKTRNDGFIENVVVAVLSSSLDLSDGENGDDDVLIEIMCTGTNSEIRKICATYQQLFGKRLEQSIREDKSGNFKRMLESLAAGTREESPTTDLKSAKIAAEELKKAFSQTMPDEKAIVELFCTTSYAQIKLISTEFRKIQGKSLEKSVKRKFGDNVKDALVAIIRCANNRPEYFARRINKAINNHLVDNRALGRLIIVRSEVDLMNIKEEFARLFRKQLKLCLKNEVHGSYKHAILTLLGDE